MENGKLGGKATITVTSADESETKTYTVTFKAFTLASLKVTGPTKTEYAIGDKLDTAGLKVTAVYRVATRPRKCRSLLTTAACDWLVRLHHRRQEGDYRLLPWCDRDLQRHGQGQRSRPWP